MSKQGTIETTAILKYYLLSEGIQKYMVYPVCQKRGYRVIVFFKSEERTFYQYGFSKADRGNVDQKELQLYKKIAQTKLAMSEEELTDAVNAGELIEI